MSMKFSDSREFLNRLQLYVNIMIASPMLIFIYFLLQIENQTYKPELFDEETLFYMRIGILFITLIMVIMAVVAFKKQVDSINPEIHLRDKLELYFSAAITRSYLFELATITVIIGMLLSGESVYFAYYTITLVAFSITYPTMHRIVNQIRLKKDEKEILLSRKKIE